MKFTDEITALIERYSRAELEHKIDGLRCKVDKESDFARGIAAGQVIADRCFVYALQELKAKAEGRLL